MAPDDVPEITVQEVARKRHENESLILLDVREAHELGLARLGDGVDAVPMSELVWRRLEALPEKAREKDAEIVVFCHHGMRSAQVVAWLRGQGWHNVWNMRGGIDAYAREVDASVGVY